MDKIKIPILDMLKNHQGQNPISLHVPGHKSGNVTHPLTPPALHEAMSWDMTELTGLDDLHSPEEGIKEAETLLSSFYQTDKSYFLVNGSTVGNLAMILGTIHAGDTVLVQRNCHKSVMNGLALASAKPIFIHPELDNEGIEIGLTASLVKVYLDKYPETRAVILTYPNYYGMGMELDGIIRVAHQQQIPVLVDEAHGAHFAAGDPFPPSSLQRGADIVVHSAHKTLPAMTMGSYLHVQGELVAAKQVERYLRMLQSSSPSYPIMLSLDLARAYLEGYGEEDKIYLAEQVRLIKDYLTAHRHLALYEASEADWHDPLKLMIHHQGNLSGYELQARLEEVGIYPELSTERFVLLVLPLLKAGHESFIKEFIERVELIEWKTAEKPAAETGFLKGDIGNVRKHSELALSYEEMETLSIKRLELPLSVGEIAAEAIIPYPPGIPLIQRGERITDEMVAACLRLLKNGVKIQGGTYLKEGQIQVFAQGL